MAVYGKLTEPVGMYDLFYYPLSSGLCALNISLLLSGQRPRGKKSQTSFTKSFCFFMTRSYLPKAMVRSFSEIWLPSMPPLFNSFSSFMFLSAFCRWIYACLLVGQSREMLSTLTVTVQGGQSISSPKGPLGKQSRV